MDACVLTRFRLRSRVLARTATGCFFLGNLGILPPIKREKACETGVPRLGSGWWVDIGDNCELAVSVYKRYLQGVISPVTDWQRPQSNKKDGYRTLPQNETLFHPSCQFPYIPLTLHIIITPRTLPSQFSSRALVSSRFGYQSRMRSGGFAVCTCIIVATYPTLEGARILEKGTFWVD